MRFLFGDIIVDVEQVALFKNTKRIEFEPRVFELLVYFCQHPQEAISREELVAQVWRGRVVSDAAINRAVGELRKLIEDDSSAPKWIKTVSKVGYRFTEVPTLQHITDEASSAELMANAPAPKNNKASHDGTITVKESSEQKLPWLSVSRVWLLAVLLLIIIFLYKLSDAKSEPEALRVVAWQPITSTLGSAFNASFEPKTGSLVYLHRANADATAQLQMKKADGSIQAISDDNYYYTDVLFASDGFIYASRLNNLQQRLCEIVKIDLSTMVFSTVVECGTRVVTQLAYDQRKRRLIYRSRASISEPYAMYSYQLDTGRKQQLTHPAQTGNTVGDYAFAISPDFQALAVIEYSGDETDKIKLISLNDNSITLSATVIDNVYGMMWHSADKILLANNTGLFDFNIDHSLLKNIAHGDQFSRLSIGDSPRTVITERSQSTVNIVSYSMQNGELKPLTKSSGINLNPTLGNNTNVLAFVSNRAGKEQVYIQDENENVSVAKFDEEIAYIGAISWSPNDDEIVASINNSLYLYSLNNKKWQKIAENFTKVHHVAFTSGHILFSAEVDGQWNIWQLSLNNKRVTQLTTKGGYSVQGNKNNVYYTKFNQPGLYQLDVKTGVESMLIAEFPISGWRHWQWRDNRIYYLKDKSYMALNLNTGEHQVMFNFKGRIPNSCHTAYEHNFFACEKVDSSSSNVWQFQLSN